MQGLKVQTHPRKIEIFKWRVAKITGLIFSALYVYWNATNMSVRFEK